MSNCWQRTELGQHIDLLTGFPFKSSAYSEDENAIRLLRGDNIIQGAIRWEGVKRWVNTFDQKIQRYELIPGDFVIAMDRTWVKAGLKASLVTDADVPSYLVQRVARLRAKKSLETHFLPMLIRGHKFEQYVKGVQTETAVPHISPQQIKDFPVVVPPLPEQKAIADLLSTWDEAIEKTERLIQVKERQLDAYARDLFDQKNECKYDGWKVVRLKTALNEHGDKSTGFEKVYSVSVHKGLVNQVEHLGRSFSAENTDNYNCVHFGDIVYTKSPTGDFPLGIVKQSYAENDVIVSPLYGVFTPKTFSLGIVLDFYFSSPTRARNYLFPIVQKGAKNTIAITNKIFLSNTLHLPVDEQAQKDVAEFVVIAREEIDLLKRLAEKYKAQKRGLMQKMLTGEWRVRGFAE